MRGGRYPLGCGFLAILACIVYSTNTGICASDQKKGKRKYGVGWMDSLLPLIIPPPNLLFFNINLNKPFREIGYSIFWFITVHQVCGAT